MKTKVIAILNDYVLHDLTYIAYCPPPHYDNDSGMVTSKTHSQNKLL